MPNRRSCPVCGGKLTENEEKCGICGLEGLNQLFLSRDAYEKWVNEVLKPHKEKLSCQVFVGSYHGLILTGWGDLYGIGDNSRRQLTDTEQQFYDRPVLMARNVISAAAMCNETCYVTKDGQLHWHSVIEGYPKITDVRTVYGDNCTPRCWVVRNNGEVLCFGLNFDELLAVRTKTLLCELPEISKRSYNFSVTNVEWSDGSAPDWMIDIKEHFKKRQEYQKLAQEHGERNLELEENEVEPNKVLKATLFAFAIGLQVYRPKIYLLNKIIDEPVPFAKAWRADLPHRIAGRPLLEEECRKYEWDDLPGVAKIVEFGGTWFRSGLKLMEDGTVETYDGAKLKWLEQGAVDIAVSDDMIMIACANGDILWCKNLADVKEGTVSRFRLSEAQ